MPRQKEPIRLQEGEHYTIGRMAWLMAEAEYPKAISASNQRVVFIATIQAKNGTMRPREPEDMRAMNELWQLHGLPELFREGEYPRTVPADFDLAPYNEALNSEHWRHDWRPLLCDSTTNRSCRAGKAMYQYSRNLRDEAVAGAFTAFTDERERARPGTSQELFVSAKEAARYLQDVQGYTVILEAAGQRQDPETLAISRDKTSPPEWIGLAQERAKAIYKEYKARDSYPNQITVADLIAKEFRDKGITGTGGKPLSGATIKRHALTGISSARQRQLSTTIKRGKWGNK